MLADSKQKAADPSVSSATTMMMIKFATIRKTELEQNGAPPEHASTPGRPLSLDDLTYFKFYSYMIQLQLQLQ